MPGVEGHLSRTGVVFQSLFLAEFLRPGARYDVDRAVEYLDANVALVKVRPKHALPVGSQHCISDFANERDLLRKGKHLRVVFEEGIEQGLLTFEVKLNRRTLQAPIPN
jgi:hypothetical protein